MNYTYNLWNALLIGGIGSCATSSNLKSAFKVLVRKIDTSSLPSERDGDVVAETDVVAVAKALGDAN